MAKVDEKAQAPAETPPTADRRRPATRVRAGALATALKDVIGAVAGRNTVPALEFVRFEAGDGCTQHNRGEAQTGYAHKVPARDRTFLKTSHFLEKFLWRDIFFVFAHVSLPCLIVI